jgi:ubiquinone/menaquinone biosynthesis C-methylase UbiE
MDKFLSKSSRDLADWWYSSQYHQSYEGLAGLGHRVFHSQLESNLKSKHFGTVLELGADRGQHLEFVKHSYDEYLMTDLRGIAQSAQSHIISKFPGKKITFREENAENLSFPDESFDRIVVTCVLPHLDQPEKALMEILRVLRVGGVLDLYVGHDPSLVFDAFKRAGPIMSAKRKGLEAIKTLLDSREHLSSGKSLLRITRHVFRSARIKEKSFPIRGSYHFSLWSVLRITKQ